MRFKADLFRVVAEPSDVDRDLRFRYTHWHQPMPTADEAAAPNVFSLSAIGLQMPTAFAIHKLINRAEDLTTLALRIDLETDLIVQAFCLKHFPDVGQGVPILILFIGEGISVLDRFPIGDREIKIGRWRRLINASAICVLRRIARRASEKTTTDKTKNAGVYSVHLFSSAKRAPSRASWAKPHRPCWADNDDRARYTSRALPLAFRRYDAPWAVRS